LASATILTRPGMHDYPGREQMPRIAGQRESHLLKA
jgi:hypothetical protein